MRTLATLVSLLGGVALASIFGAIGDAQAQTLDCTPNVYGGMICQGRTPGPTFNAYPSNFEVFDYGKAMRDAEALRTQRLQNQLLQQQLQQQRWQLQQQTPSQPIRAASLLDRLRASGAVGERYDGYAQALQSGAAGVVQQVNAKRRQIYQQTANREGTSVDRIGRVYAQHIFAKAPPGTKFLQGNGSWIAK